jgi:uncharacterized protein YutE (UPF0331/DUF86 family)
MHGGTITVGSDIDLLIVYRGEERVDTYALVKKLLDLPHLEPHIYSEAEYELGGFRNILVHGYLILD